MTLDPLHDPLKGRAVVPQKYVDALERQGWVKVVRCEACISYDEKHRYCEKYRCVATPNWYCAGGERADAPTCGPDYCEIGGSE